MPQPWTIPRLPFLALAASLSASAALAGPAVTVDLAKAKGAVTSETLNAAIADARQAFATDPTTVYTITIPAGTFQMPATISLDKIDPSGGGRLVIQGAGKDQTTIVQSGDTVGLQGRDTNHVTVQGMTFTLPGQSVTQGHVVSVADKQVVIDIAQGFPQPDTLMDAAYKGVTGCQAVDKATGAWGRFLKKMVDTPTGPQFADPNQNYFMFCIPQPVDGHPGRWLFPLKPAKGGPSMPDWAPGDLIAIKSKFMANTYHFCGGDDFEFKDVRWLQRSRGIWRCGFNDVHLDGVEVRRPAPIDGQIPALSSPGGGPQFGELGMPTKGHLVENSYFEATGDDALAFFNADGEVRNTTVTDAFGRVNLNQSDVKLTNNQFIRTRLVRQ